jgi:sugar phosphate isomerase/epimerase
MAILKLGTVTYNLAKDWDIQTIIENCTETGFEGVELRTTHAHGVEIELSSSERDEVKKRFADSAIELVGLGSAYEYHAIESAELQSNIEGTKAYAELARDVGASGIKVRPNGLQTEAGIPVEKTLEQIGKALSECAGFAADIGIQIRLEVHGRDTSHVPYVKKIFDFADHPNLYACWNSNQNDLEDGGLEENFAMLSGRIGLVHMRDIYLSEYPWKRMLGMLVESGYRGYCCAEIPESDDPIRVMHYYRALFDEYLAG